MTDRHIVLGLLLATSIVAPSCASASTPAARPSEQPSVPSAPAPLPAVSDGRRFAILQAVRMSGGEIAVVADFAEVLRGDEASAAAAARDPLFRHVTGYLVVNDAKEPVRLLLAPSARVRCLAGEGAATREMAPAAFLERWFAAEDGDAIRRDLYSVEIRDGAVTLLEQQYLR